MAKKSKAAAAPVAADEQVPTASTAPVAVSTAPVTSQVTDGADDDAPASGDNSKGWDKRKALSDVFKLGQAEAQGLISRTEIARTLIRAASELSDVSAGDADKFYTAYAKGKSKNPDAVFEAKDAGRSQEAQISKLAVWLKFGELPPSAFDGLDAVETFDHINEQYKKLAKSGEKPPQSRFDSLATVARKWIKANTKPADGKYRALTDDEIAGIILPSDDKAQKDDWQKLADMVRKLEGLEAITSDKRTSSIIEEGSTVGATFGALVSDMKRLFTDAGRADLVAPKEAKKAEAKAVEAVAYMTQDAKYALLLKLQAELSA